MGVNLLAMSKRRKFATEYVVDQNATQAAIRAGYSEHTAYSQGSRLLKNVEVREVIKTQQHIQAQRVDVQVDEIVDGLKTIAVDPSAPPAARVSAWKALGEYKGMFATGVREVPPQVLSLLELLRKQSDRST
jgi:hypothetical protein